MLKVGVGPTVLASVRATGGGMTRPSRLSTITEEVRASGPSDTCPWKFTPGVSGSESRASTEQGRLLLKN